MRWEALFADLEAQWDAAEAAELAAEVADRTRREAGYLRLIDRMRPAVGHPLRLFVLGSAGAEPGVLTGRLLSLGVDWFLVEETAGTETVVPARSLLGVQGLAGSSAQPGHEGPLAARLDLRYLLRGVARDRSSCVLVLIDGSVVSGTLDRVGADFVELAEHAVGEYRRVRDARELRTVPIGAIALVRRGR
jgi:hypothetical protein